MKNQHMHGLANKAAACAVKRLTLRDNDDLHFSRTREQINALDDDTIFELCPDQSGIDWLVAHNPAGSDNLNDWRRVANQVERMCQNETLNPWADKILMHIRKESRK